MDFQSSFVFFPMFGSAVLHFVVCKQTYFDLIESERNCFCFIWYHVIVDVSRRGVE